MVHNEYDGEEAVQQLLAKGPEALESQFVPGYRMALSLLRLRSLPQAADFVQRSFSNFLGTCSPQVLASRGAWAVVTRSACAACPRQPTVCSASTTSWVLALLCLCTLGQLLCIWHAAPLHCNRDAAVCWPLLGTGN